MTARLRTSTTRDTGPPPRHRYDAEEKETYGFSGKRRYRRAAERDKPPKAARADASSSEAKGGADEAQHGADEANGVAPGGV